MNELALFAGAGGGILGGRLLGWRTVCAVELDPYARDVLVARQNDGCLAPFPVWDDIRTFDGRPWRGVVDVVSGGFPCQDISSCGRGAGIDGERSGLWREMARVVGEVGPRFVWVENSPLLTGRGLAVVLGDLAQMGFDARWGVVGARHAGAPHRRDRIWILADIRPGDTRTGLESLPRCGQRPAGGGEAEGAGADSGRGVRGGVPEGGGEDAGRVQADGPAWWSAEPAVGRVADGVASGVDRLRCLGNGQVPHAMHLAWGILNTRDVGEESLDEAA